MPKKMYFGKDVCPEFIVFVNRRDCRDCNYAVNMRVDHIECSHNSAYGPDSDPCSGRSYDECEIGGCDHGNEC
jgi:hypothetical protein